MGNQDALPPDCPPWLAVFERRAEGWFADFEEGRFEKFTRAMNEQFGVACARPEGIAHRLERIDGRAAGLAAEMGKLTERGRW